MMFYRFDLSSKCVKCGLLALLLMALSACVTVPVQEPTIQAQQNYILSDHYANHRVQQKIFSTAQGDIAYLDYGDGPVLLMMHGVPASSWLYRKMVVELQQNFRVIAIDLLGYGGSDKPASNQRNYTPNAQANYINALLSHLEVTQYSLLFHDMGGLVAWEIASQDVQGQQQIKNLIVLNTIISKHGFKHPKMEKGAMARAMSKAYSSKLSSAAILKMTFDNMGLTSNANLNENECRGYVQPMQEGQGDALYDFFTGFDDDLFERVEQQIGLLSQFSGNTLILWGAEDKVLTTEQIPILVEALNVPEQNVQIYSENAHFLPEEIPDQLNEAIISFLKSDI